MTKKDPYPLVRVQDRPEERTFSHPINPRSEMRGVSLSDAAGLRRVGLHLVRVPPGKESNLLHAHTVEEEFYFVLSGRGVVELGDEEREIGPGDFLGFPTPSLPHLLKNPFDEDLVYLVGGERREVEIGTFPKLGKRVLRIGREALLVDEADLRPFWKPEE
jgi:uncharacterized cupin superfamily protein